MFDNGFERSKFYFNTLQLLRIFSQAVRDTRPGIDALNPDYFAIDFSPPKNTSDTSRPFIHPDSNPMKDDVLKTNYDILWKFYHKEETRLLQRIADKTEEIKSLRDGVCAVYLRRFWSAAIFLPLCSGTSCSTRVLCANLPGPPQ
jgi:hypothetical protein